MRVNRYSSSMRRTRRFSESEITEKVKMTDIVSQKYFDRSVEEILNFIVSDVNELVAEGETPEDALEQALVNVGDPGFWNDDEVNILISGSKFFQSLTIDKLQNIVKFYDLDEELELNPDDEDE